MSDDLHDGPFVVIPLGPGATREDGEAIKEMIHPLIGHFVADRRLTLPVTEHLIKRIFAQYKARS